MHALMASPACEHFITVVPYYSASFDPNRFAKELVTIPALIHIIRRETLARTEVVRIPRVDRLF